LNKEIISKIVRWIVVLAIPFLITLGTVRLIMSWNAPDYPGFEYNRIQPDRFGMRDDDRLAYARASLDYLLHPNSAEDAIYLLEDLRLPDSEQSFYNDREIGHMLDVKKVVDAFRTAMWVLAIIVALGLILLLARPETRVEGYKALFYGGSFTVVVVIAVIVLIGLSWNFVFVQFHEILFPPGSWTFSNSDSLIRLFPEKFWFDFGLIWTVSILLVGLLVGGLGYLLLRKKPIS